MQNYEEKNSLLEVFLIIFDDLNLTENTHRRQKIRNGIKFPL